mgnify:CR=1 FL=1
MYVTTAAEFQNNNIKKIHHHKNITEIWTLTCNICKSSRWILNILKLQDGNLQIVQCENNLNFFLLNLF